MRCRRVGAWLYTVVICSATCLVSCGPALPRTVPVAGRVSFDDGAPVPGAGIELAIQADGRRINARGVSDAEGRFVLGTFREADGAVPGKHTAIVVGPLGYAGGALRKNGAHAQVLERYAVYATSGLTVVVPESGGDVAIGIERR